MAYNKQVRRKTFHKTLAATKVIKFGLTPRYCGKVFEEYVTVFCSNPVEVLQILSQTPSNHKTLYLTDHSDSPKY